MSAQDGTLIEARFVLNFMNEREAADCARELLNHSAFGIIEVLRGIDMILRPRAKGVRTRCKLRATTLVRVPLFAAIHISGIERRMTNNHQRLIQQFYKYNTT